MKLHLAKYKPLSPEREYELFKLYIKSDKKDESIREELILRNLRLVQKIANRYSLIYEDAFSEGLIGLYKAIDNFDPNYKSNTDNKIQNISIKDDTPIRFSTYAFSWIQQTIRTGINNRRDTVRLPYHKDRNYLLIYEREIELESINNVIPILEDKTIQKLLDFIINHSSRGKSREEAYNDYLKFFKSKIDITEADLKRQYAVEKDPKAEDFIQDIENEVFVEQLMDLAKLKENEKVILKHYYGLGGLKAATFKEIPSILKQQGLKVVGEQRIQQQHREILDKLLDAYSEIH